MVEVVVDVDEGEAGCGTTLYPAASEHGFAYPLISLPALFFKQGVDGFVLGTSSLFGHLGTYKDIINRIKHECGD